MLNELRLFVFERFAIKPKTRNCKERSLNLLFILRHDYKSHIRNVDGVIDRKISNEKEILSNLSIALPRWNISAIQLDSYTIDRQIQEVTSFLQA